MIFLRRAVPVLLSLCALALFLLLEWIGGITWPLDVAAIRASGPWRADHPTLTSLVTVPVVDAIPTTMVLAWPEHSRSLALAALVRVASTVAERHRLAAGMTEPILDPLTGEVVAPLAVPSGPTDLPEPPEPAARSGMGSLV